MRNSLFAVFLAVALQVCAAEDNVTTTAPVPATEVTSTTTTPVPPSIPSASPYNYTNKRKIICNFNSKLPSNRQDKYTLDDVDSTLCSHVIYNSASLDPTTLTIDASSLASDLSGIVSLKQKGVPIILTVGDSLDLKTSESFSRIVNDGTIRTAFVANTVNLLKSLKLNGLNVNWQFPTCWQGYCARNHGRLSDRRTFVALLRDLRAAFDYYGFQLMVSVSPLEAIADNAYDVPGISFFSNYVLLQTYDFNNQSYSQTSIHSAFQGNPSTVRTIEYWLARMADPRKLIVGIPTYGRTFTLAKEAWNTVGSPAMIGKTTGVEVPGIAAYFEICKNLDYQFVEKVGSYAYKADQWVSFDDITTIKLKGEYISKHGLAGALITSLDMDDYSGTLCGQGKYPLVKTMREALGL